MQDVRGLVRHQVPVGGGLLFTEGESPAVILGLVHVLGGVPHDPHGPLGGKGVRHHLVHHHFRRSAHGPHDRYAPVVASQRGPQAMGQGAVQNAHDLQARVLLLHGLQGGQADIFAGPDHENIIDVINGFPMGPGDLRQSFFHLGVHGVYVRFVLQQGIHIGKIPDPVRRHAEEQADSVIVRRLAPSLRRLA